jgi:adenylate kinase family enzyme
MINNSYSPRILNVGCSGSGKKKFGKEMSKLGWKHISIDDQTKSLENFQEIYKMIPDEDFCIVTWSIVVNNLKDVIETIFNKKYNLLIFQSDINHTQNYLKNLGFEDAYIYDKERYEVESEAKDILVWLFSNVININISDYFLNDGSFKNEEFVKRCDFYYKNKLKEIGN